MTDVIAQRSGPTNFATTPQAQVDGNTLVCFKHPRADRSIPYWTLLCARACTLSSAVATELPGHGEILCPGHKAAITTFNSIFFGMLFHLFFHLLLFLSFFLFLYPPHYTEH